MYCVETDGLAAEQSPALPDEALSGYAQMLGVLELVLWNGARRRRRGACLPEVVASLQVRP